MILTWVLLRCSETSIYWHPFSWRYVLTLWIFVLFCKLVLRLLTVWPLVQSWAVCFGSSNLIFGCLLVVVIRCVVAVFPFFDPTLRYCLSHGISLILLTVCSCTIRLTVFWKPSVDLHLFVLDLFFTLWASVCGCFVPSFQTTFCDLSSWFVVDFVFSFVLTARLCTDNIHVIRGSFQALMNLAVSDATTIDDAT